MNRCKCKLCGDVIQSRHRHDFVRCKCGEIFTDGGEDYVRRGAMTSFENLIDLPGPEEVHQEELNAILRQNRPAVLAELEKEREE